MRKPKPTTKRRESAAPPTLVLEFDPYFGVCPICGRHDGGYLNIGRGHWFLCRAHRKCWCAGENLFSSWRHETEADWRANFLEIKDFEDLTNG